MVVCPPYISQFMKILFKDKHVRGLQILMCYSCSVELS